MYENLGMYLNQIIIDENVLWLIDTVAIAHLYLL